MLFLYMLGWIREVIKKILLVYIIYVFIGAVLIFAMPKKVSPEYLEESSHETYYSDQVGRDRAIILDNPLEAGLARLFIIENAKETLNICYFSIGRGETPHIFLGALFDAADRGVQVNILLDGIFHGLRGPRRPIIYAISNHPNMNLKFYEKFNPLLPWTINNRMHDKFIIADNNISIIGGRNIGDKYFAPEWHEKSISNDRDVVVINFSENDEVSVVDEISDYFHEIWKHKFSQDVNLWTRSIFRKKGEISASNMREKASKSRKVYEDQFEKLPDLYNISLPTNKVSFIRNPIERFSKEPWCWYEIVQLCKASEESIFIQSPYIIPSKKMTRGLISSEDLENMNITFLTNSLASTPNLLAFSGYANYRSRMVDNKINILEIQSSDSIHSKSFVIDNNIVGIGSFNLDGRSSFLSTESMVVIHSEQVVEEFTENVFTYIDESLLVGVDYEYVDNKKIQEKQASILKKMLVKFLAIPIRLFDYLL